MHTLSPSLYTDIFWCTYLQVPHVTTFYNCRVPYMYMAVVTMPMGFMAALNVKAK